mmetsp:Transcript_24584/g.56278  ORF Transcript_24584/g.56278 Transcript_24584/m.56278 type:complete len:347 (-) Transcript_24584:1939-2979(-)
MKYVHQMESKLVLLLPLPLSPFKKLDPHVSKEFLSSEAPPALPSLPPSLPKEFMELAFMELALDAIMAPSKAPPNILDSPPAMPPEFLAAEVGSPAPKPEPAAPHMLSTTETAGSSIRKDLRKELDDSRFPGCSPTATPSPPPRTEFRWRSSAGSGSVPPRPRDRNEGDGTVSSVLVSVEDTSEGTTEFPSSPVPGRSNARVPRPGGLERAPASGARTKAGGGSAAVGAASSTAGGMPKLGTNSLAVARMSELLRKSSTRLGGGRGFSGRPGGGRVEEETRAGSGWILRRWASRASASVGSERREEEARPFFLPSAGKWTEFISRTAGGVGSGDLDRTGEECPYGA